MFEQECTHEEGRELKKLTDSGAAAFLLLGKDEARGIVNIYYFHHQCVVECKKPLTKGIYFKV